jgi:hypothetical protein
MGFRFGQNLPKTPAIVCDPYKPVQAKTLAPAILMNEL